MIRATWRENSPSLGANANQREPPRRLALLTSRRNPMLGRTFVAVGKMMSMVTFSGRFVAAV
jgi:hypothetical protein